MPLTIDSTSYRSPNHSPRHGHPITMLVLHATAGSARSALSWLCSPASKVSASYLIDKSGRVYQLVADSEAAWHAGVARWNGETAINEVSLGVELENANDGKEPYPPAQYAALLELSRMKVAEYHIALDNVVRHLDIALPKGRKTDPAGFPWAQFKADLLAALPFDPLRTQLLPGPGGKQIHCGDGFARFYADYGGFLLFGYPLRDESRDTDLLGRACTWMPMERATMKYIEGEGVHLALAAEAEAKGWI